MVFTLHFIFTVLRIETSHFINWNSILKPHLDFHTKTSVINHSWLWTIQLRRSIYGLLNGTLSTAQVIGMMIVNDEL